MIDIDLLKRTFKYRVNNNQQGDLSLDGFNNLAYLSSIMLYNKYLGLEEQYNPQTRSAIIEYPQTKKIHTELLPFKTYKNIPYVKELGYIPMPDDVFYILNVRSVYFAERRDSSKNQRLRNCGCTEEKEGSNVEYIKYTKDIKFVPEDKWSNRVSSAILKSDSYCTYSDRIEFDFKRLIPVSIRVEYLKLPQSPKWGYVINNGVPVYDSTTSRHLEWNLSQLDRITERMDNLFSRNLSDGFGTNFSQSKIMRGE